MRSGHSQQQPSIRQIGRIPLPQLPMRFPLSRLRDHSAVPGSEWFAPVSRCANRDNSAPNLSIRLGSRRDRERFPTDQENFANFRWSSASGKPSFVPSNDLRRCVGFRRLGWGPGTGGVSATIRAAPGIVNGRRIVDSAFTGPADQLGTRQEPPSRLVSQMFAFQAELSPNTGISQRTHYAHASRSI